MKAEELEERRLALDEARLALDKAKQLSDESFFRKFSTPLLTLAGTIIAGTLTFAQVYIASLEKDKEVAAAQIEKDKEIEIARLDQDRRWKLEVADFVFKNKDTIFPDQPSKAQQQIFTVMAITFPPEITDVLFSNLKRTFAEEQPQSLNNVQAAINKINASAVKFVHSTGYFLKNGATWTEFPPYAPGEFFTFLEARRDGSYIYMVDKSRHATDDANNFMYIRIPINGGFSQWSFAHPLQWTNLYLEKPV